MTTTRTTRRLWTQIENDLVCQLRLAGLKPAVIAQSIQHLRPGIAASTVSTRLHKFGAAPPAATWMIEDNATYRRAAQGEITDEEALHIVKERYIHDQGEDAWARLGDHLSSQDRKQLAQAHLLEPLHAEIPTDPEAIPDYCRKIIDDATVAVVATLAAELEKMKPITEPRACPLCGCVPELPK